MKSPSELHDSGFEIVPTALDRSEVVALGKVLKNVALQRSRAGARHLMGHPAVSSTAKDPRLLGIASRFVGADPVPFRATLFDKSARNNWLVVWHQDTALPLCGRCDLPGWGPWSVKRGVTYAHAPAAALSRVIAVRLHIDDSRHDNGPLRVLPGTHALGLLSESEIEHHTKRIPPVDCVVLAGGVVAMRPLILHASSKAETDHPRRVLHIEYADSLGIAPGLELAIA